MSQSGKAFAEQYIKDYCRIFWQKESNRKRYPVIYQSYLARLRELDSKKRQLKVNLTNAKATQDHDLSGDKRR